MLISVKHRFVFLCMPKCASTSTEAALEPCCEIRLGGNPKLKHVNLRDYLGNVAPFLRHYFGSTIDEFDILCLFRHPIGWLNSWYRFRQKEAQQGKRRGPGPNIMDLTFQDYLELYANDKRGPVHVGRQIDRITDDNGQLGRIVLFRYENYARFLDYLSRKTGRSIAEKRLNISPGEPTDISHYNSYLLSEKIGPDWAVYQSIPEQ